MENVQIEWGNLGRSEALEADVFTSAEKILTFAPQATNLIVTFKIINPKTSAGPSMQQVSMELRLSQHKDIRSEKKGEDLYRAIKEAERAILTQLEKKKNT